MRKFLSVLLAVMMVLSTISYAIPSVVEVFDSAFEFDGDEIETVTENTVLLSVVTHKVTHKSTSGEVLYAEADTVIDDEVDSVRELVAFFAGDERFASPAYTLKKVVIGSEEYSGNDAIDLTSSKTLTVVWDVNEWLGEYGEKIFEINFDNMSRGAISSGLSALTSGAVFNPGHNASKYASSMNLYFRNATAEILTQGSRKYIRYKPTVDGTDCFWYLTSGNYPFTTQDGYFIFTYEFINNSDAAVPHTFRFNLNNKIEDATNNILIIDNRNWDSAVVYYDEEIGSSGSRTHDDGTYSIDSTNDITLLKWHNTSGVVSGKSICLDTLTLWFVPKTVTLTIDNSAIGKADVVIENYPTTGMTISELSALLPASDRAKFAGFSTTPGGEVLDTTRVVRDTTLYSNWAVDTLLTVDMNGNNKLEPMTFVLSGTSSIKVSDIEAKFIDHGDMKFAGISYSKTGPRLSSSEVIKADGSESMTVYALWEKYYTNGFFSVEFDGGKYGYLKSNLNPGRNSKHRTDALDAEGVTVAGNPDNAIEWNEDGYITINYVASDYAKATAKENGLSAVLYDSFFQVDGISADGNYIKAGTVDQIAIRMRYRGMPGVSTSLWRADNGTTVTYNPANVFAPYFFYTSDSVAAFGNANAVKYVSLETGSAYRDSWFTVFMDASAIKMDKENLYSLRMDAPDSMPDGSAIDIDFIRFISFDSKKDYTSPISRKDRTTLRVASEAHDQNKYGEIRNGIRFLAQISNNVRNKAGEMGLMFTASERWNATTSDVSGKRNPYELTMDLYNNASFNKKSLIIAGFTIKDGERQTAGYYEEDDLLTAFTTVLYGIPLKNYKSKFIVRPFVKVNGAYAYGEPFEVDFYTLLKDILEDSENDRVIEYCRNELDKFDAYSAEVEEFENDERTAALNTLMSTRSGILSNLVIPTNDTLPVVVDEDTVKITVWKNGALTQINVSTYAYPALITDGKLSEAYTEKPCIVSENDNEYFIRSLGRAVNPIGDYIGVNKTDSSVMSGSDSTKLFLSEISGDDIVSPFQRLPVDDELTNGKESFFLGDFATGQFEFTFSRANSATRKIMTGKTGIVDSDTKVVAKYNFPDGTSEWVSYAKSQLLKFGLDSNVTIAHGIDFDNITYIVSNNTTVAGENQREYENLALLVGEVDVPNYITTTSNFNAAKYNKLLVKTTSGSSYVTVKWTRNDGVSDSLKVECYGLDSDLDSNNSNYKIYDIDMSGVSTWYSTISSLSVTTSGGSVTYTKILEDPDYYSSDDLASMNKIMIFQDTNFENGFYVRDMDQKAKKDEWQNYKFASNGNSPLWMIDPWYSYDYSGTKSNFELYPHASETATSITDTKGSKVVKFNGTKTSTFADGSQHTGAVLSMTLNCRTIYNGKTHTQMQNAGMTYWPHLLIEQATTVCSVDKEATNAGADKIYMEMDIRMPSYVYQKHSSWDQIFGNVGTKQLSFLLYTYLRPKANPNDRIWFGASLCSNGATEYPTWNRDTGASAYIYCIPQEVVFQGIKNSFYQKVNALSKTGSGTSSTSMDWVHISLDVTPYIQTAIDWANREDAFGLGTLTRDDFYFDGVNIGFETHGNIDGTFEIANFNFVSYNAK